MLPSACQIPVFLFRTGYAFQHHRDATRITDIAEHRECMRKLLLCFIRLFEEIVDFAKICKRPSFTANISDFALNLNRLLVILNSLFVLTLVGQGFPDLVEGFGFLAAIAGCLLNCPRLVEVRQRFLVITQTTIRAADVKERLSLIELVVNSDYQGKKLL